MDSEVEEDSESDATASVKKKARAQLKDGLGKEPKGKFIFSLTSSTLNCFI